MGARNEQDVRRAALDEVMEKLKGPARAARTLGAPETAVKQWPRLGGVPPLWTIPVYRATGVSPHRLNPTLYPRDIVVIKRIEFTRKEQ